MKRFLWLFRTNQSVSAITVLGIIAILWEMLVRAFHIPVFVLPAPLVIGRVILDAYHILLKQTWYTAEACLLGFALAVILGVGLAIAIVQSQLVERTAYTLLVSMNSIPKVAIAPVFIVWLGTGLEPKVAIAMLVAIFAIVVETVHGLKSVDPDMLDLGRALGATRLRMLVKIQFPHALPNMFSGMKVGIALALVGGIVGEFVASRKGLGYVILVAQGQFDTPTMFAALVVLAVLGTALFFIVDLFERLVIPWHVSQRKEEPKVFSA
jgi:NitT/TauT family transport system permease protein